MRISDWSSDVCSSDLIAEPQIETGWRPGATQLFQGRRIVVIGNACDRSADHASMAWPYTIGLDGVATPAPALVKHAPLRSEEHTSELQSLMRTSYAVFCLKKTHNTPD